MKITSTIVKKMVLASFCLTLLNNVAKAQDQIDVFLEAGVEDAETLLQNYINPFVKGFGYGINNGWNHTAKPHKTLGFDLMVTVNAARIPSKDEFFTFINSDYTYVELSDASNDQLPTVFGPAEQGPELRFLDNNGDEVIRITSPQGIGLEEEIGHNIVPTPMVQLGLGLFKGTDLKLRYVPKIDFGDGEFNLFGIGLMHEEGVTQVDIEAILLSLESSFNLNPVLFLVPVVVIGMIIKKAPAVPALLTGTLLGGVFAVIFQPQVIEQIGGGTGGYAYQSYVAVMKSMYGDISIATDNALVNDLLSTGGMAGMLKTIWLILCAMVYGGIMESSGLLHKITETIIGFVHSTGSLIASTVGTCIFFNVTASDQYLAIVVPGRMYADTYRDRGLKPENLSRTLEDSATVTSVLVPWNTCGATQSGVLGVATLIYAPYCFFNIISPIMTLMYGYFQIKIKRIPANEQQKKEVA